MGINKLQNLLKQTSLYRLNLKQSRLNQWERDRFQQESIIKIFTKGAGQNPTITLKNTISQFNLSKVTYNQPTFSIRFRFKL